MIKNLFKTLGAGCILAGVFLYFSNSVGKDGDLLVENNQMKNEIASLQSQLQRTEGELANLQTITSEASQAETEKQENNESVVKIILHITPGTSSKDVANNLARASIIEDAEALNTYLTSQDLAKKIQIGEYELDSSMSIETIAKEITGTN